MKQTQRTFLLLGIALAGLPTTALFSQEEEAKPKMKHKDLIDEQVVEEIHIPDHLKDAVTITPRTWWSKHHVQGLGLSLFDEGVIAVPKPIYYAKDSDNKDINGVGYIDGKFEALKPGEVDTNNPLADVVPARTQVQLGWVQELDSITSIPFPLVLVRMQDDLSSKPFDAQPGTFLWSSDSDKGDSTMVNAALLADMYFAGIGEFGRYSSQGMFHLLVGGELEKFDGGDPNSEIDIRRYLAVAEFSPGGVVSKFFGGRDKGPNYMRQTMTVGWLHEDDVINDAQRNSFQVKFAPSFNLPTDKLDMFVGERSYFAKWFNFWNPKDINAVLGGKGKGNGKADVADMGNQTNQAQTQGDKAEQVASKVKPSDLDKRTRESLDGLGISTATPGWAAGRFENFFYFRPKVGVDYGDTSVSSLLKDRELPDLNLVYSLEAGFSFAKETYHIGYRLNGFSGITKGENFTCNEFFLQATPHGWPGRLFVTYKRGEIAPSFVDVDVLQVGVGVKF